MTDHGADLTGTLDEFPLQDLLQLLAIGRKSGVVRFNGASPGILAVHDGALTIAMSDTGPTLKQVFIGSGVTTADGWDRAMRSAETGTPLVASFLDQGADDELMEQVLLEQTTGAMFELLLPSGDRFEFREGEEHPVGSRHRFPHEPVLDEANRRVDAWKIIADAIPSTAAVMALAPAIPGDEITISADEWHVLARVDGHATVADIIRELGMSAFAVCGVLHRLLGRDVVAQVG
jgi:hypothetical protein